MKLLLLMDYFSPFHLIAHPDKLNLKLEKKRILAEFSLAEAPYIQVAGKELNNDDVFRLFELLENEEEREFHTKIFSCPELVRFLEMREVNTNSLLAALEDFEADEMFIERISSDFANSVAKYQLKAFKARDASELRTLKNLPQWFGVMDEDTVYRPVERILLQYIEDLKHKTEQGDVYGWREHLKPYLGESLVRTLNALPSHYQKLIDQFAYHYSTFFYLMYKRRIRKPVVAILYHLRHLNCDYELRKNFESNYRKLSEAYPTAIPQTHEEKRKGNFAVIIAIAVVLMPGIIISMVINSGGREPAKIQDLALFDSLIKRQYYYEPDSSIYRLHIQTRPESELSYLGIAINIQPFSAMLEKEVFSHPLLDNHNNKSKNLLIIENKSKDDIIFFINDLEKLVYHQYVYWEDTVVVNYQYSHSTYVVFPSHVEYTVYAMTGRDWLDRYTFNLGNIKENGLFGIQSEQQFGIFDTGIKLKFRDAKPDSNKANLEYHSLILTATGDYTKTEFSLRDTVITEPDSVKYGTSLRIPASRSRSR